MPAADRESFEQRLLREIDTVALARTASERAARLFEVSAALGSAATTEAVAEAVLEHGVAALGASGGGILLATGDADRLSVPATVGYDEDVVARLRAESRDAELPAAVALRTGEPVWLESRDDRDQRFPQLASLERQAVSSCAVPLPSAGAGWGRSGSASPSPASSTRTSAGSSWRWPPRPPRRSTGPSSTSSGPTSAAASNAASSRASWWRPRASMWPAATTRWAAAWSSAATRSTSGRMGGDVWGVAIADAAGTGPEAARPHAP